MLRPDGTWLEMRIFEGATDLRSKVFPIEDKPVLESEAFPSRCQALSYFRQCMDVGIERQWWDKDKAEGRSSKRHRRERPLWRSLRRTTLGATTLRIKRGPVVSCNGDRLPTQLRYFLRYFCGLAAKVFRLASEPK